MPKKQIHEDFVRYAKYSLFTFFSEKLGRIQVQDFLVHGKDKDINIQLIGQKQILLSNQFIQTCDFELLMNESQAIPFYDENIVKGCQLILSKERKKKEGNILSKFLNT